MKNDSWKIIVTHSVETQNFGRYVLIPETAKNQKKLKKLKIHVRIDFWIQVLEFPVFLEFCSTLSGCDVRSTGNSIHTIPKSS